MNFQRFKRYSREDYQGAPEWFFRFIDNLNPAIDTLNELLTGNIDTTYNIQAERQIVSVTHGVSQQIRMNTLGVQPSLLRVGYAQGNLVASAAITTYNTDGTIQIVVNFATPLPTGPVSVLLVFEP